ncbi:MAG: response regulator transcription factor [Verrucomicrobiales bacterium]|jgi:DNA-binding response OmpR family regulator|nr:response regulator transcription factor [Verrucomicrobiales bacterium]
MHILLVDDYEKTREYVFEPLKRAGYSVDMAEDGEDGLQKGMTMDYDVIILDVMLPKVDGVEVLRQLRAKGNETHILILTALTAVNERVDGLRFGADDYLIKPFAVAELLARVDALGKRRGLPKANVLTIGGLVIDVFGHTVTFESREVALRPREFTLLTCLARSQGQVVSRDEIERYLYDGATEVQSNSVDSAIYRLRKDISGAGAENYIRTIHRRGYVLKAPLELLCGGSLLVREGDQSSVG